MHHSLAEIKKKNALNFVPYQLYFDGFKIVSGLSELNGIWVFERWLQVKLMEIVNRRLKLLLEEQTKLQSKLDKNLRTALKLNKVISGRDPCFTPEEIGYEITIASFLKPVLRLEPRGLMSCPGNFLSQTAANQCSPLPS